MKKQTAIASLAGLLFSVTSVSGKELPPSDLEVFCGDWIDDAITCRYYRNGREEKEITKVYQDVKFKELIKIEHAWNGKDFDEVFVLRYDLEGRLVEMLHRIAGETYIRYSFIRIEGKIITEYVHDGEGFMLRESHDSDNDGKLDKTIRYHYDLKGTLINKTLDQNGDGKIEARWDFQKGGWKPHKNL